MPEKYKYERLNIINFWVVPDAGSFIFSPVTLSGKISKILITQAEELEDFIEDQIPGRIYIDNRLVGLKSKEEAWVLSQLSFMLENDQLGHKEGLAVKRAKEIIRFFRSGEADKINKILSNSQ